MESMKFKDRFKKLRLERRLTKVAVAKELGITRQAVTQWESGKSEPTSENTRELAVYFDVNYDWLRTGRGSPSVSMLATGLSLKGEIAGGVWHEVVESQDMDFKRVPVAPSPSYPVDYQYALQVRGNSVNKIAKDGSIVTCVDVMGASIEIRDQDLVVVERRRGGLIETTIKRLRKGTNGPELWPESDDPGHQEKLTLAPQKGEAEVTVKALVIQVANPVPRGS